MNKIVTKNVYKSVISYGKNEMVFMGVNDVLYISTECNGKLYEKIKKVAQKKSKSADENMEAAIEKEIDSVYEWLKESSNGQDLYRHGIKTGKSLEIEFEREMELC